MRDPTTLNSGISTGIFDPESTEGIFDPESTKGIFDPEFRK